MNSMTHYASTRECHAFDWYQCDYRVRHYTTMPQSEIRLTSSCWQVSKLPELANYVRLEELALQHGSAEANL